MKRALLVLLFFTAAISGVYAQGEENSLKDVPPSERIIIGGGLGLGFGSYQDYIIVSPSIGYLFTKKFMGGVNLTYQYNKYKPDYGSSITTNSYGGGPFARYMVFRGIFLQTEYEFLNYDLYSVRKTYNSFFAGGGFIQPLGGKASIYFMALYNFSYQDPVYGEYYPYNSPLVIRAGISIGRFGIF